MKFTDLQPREQSIVVEMRKVILRYPGALALLVKMTTDDASTVTMRSMSDALCAELDRRASKDQACQ